MDVLMPLIKTPRDKNMSKEEFISRRSLELDSDEIRPAVFKIFQQDVESRCSIITVEGFDTSLPKADIMAALYELFHPCGYVRHLEINKDPETNLLNRCALLHLMGPGAEERALALNGSEFKGWKVVIKLLPNEVPRLDRRIVASLRAAFARKSRRVGITVEGYDLSLPKDVVEDSLIRHFCYCGEITQLALSKGFGPNANTLYWTVLVFFAKPNAVEKALALDGSDVGGWKVSVKALPDPEQFTIPADCSQGWFGSTAPAAPAPAPATVESAE